jgi:hypothetical protein
MFRILSHLLGLPKSSSSRTARRRAAPALECLEDRIAPAVINVGPGRAIKTIQGGVNAASTGDQVVVDNGAYTEQVFINKSVTVMAANPLEAIIQTPSGTLASRNTQTGGANPDDTTPLVMIYGSSAVQVTIQGFILNGPFDPQVDDIAGIYVRDGATVNVMSNYITDMYEGTTVKVGDGILVGQLGVNANHQPISTTGNATITGNTISGANRPPALFMNITGYGTDGIAVENGSTATIQNNTIGGSGPTSTTVQNGIEVRGGSVVTVQNNTVSMNQYTGPGSGPDVFTNTTAAGILLDQGGAGNGSSITGNTLSGNDVAMDILASGGITVAQTGGAVVVNGPIGSAGTNLSLSAPALDLKPNLTLMAGSAIVTLDGGTLNLGDAAPTQLIVNGQLAFTSALVYPAQINSATPGSGFDQIISSGAVNLGDATLQVNLGSGFTPGAGQSFDLIVNNSGAPVTGTFHGLPEGAIVTSSSGQPFRITYVGGTSGHDVVLTPRVSKLNQPPPASPSPSSPSPSSPSSILPPPSVSVAFGPFGEVVELVSPNGILTQFDIFGAHVLGGGVRSASVAFGPPGEELLVTFQNGALTLFDAAGAHPLGTGGVLSASLAFGPQGAVVEVVSLNGTLTQFDAGGVHPLGGGVSSTSVELTPAGEVLLVTFQNGQLFQFDSQGTHALGGDVQSASVAFDATGAEVADVITLDGTLIQFDSAGVHVLGKVL